MFVHRIAEAEAKIVAQKPLKGFAFEPEGILASSWNDTAPRGLWAPQTPHIGLLLATESGDAVIGALGVVVQLRTAGHHRSLVRIHEPLPLDGIRVQQVVEQCGQRFQSHAEHVLTEGGRIPRGTWDEITRVLSELNSEVPGYLRRMAAKYGRGFAILADSPGFDVMTLESEATDLSVRLAGGRLNIEELWTPPATPLPFLRSLPQAISVTEDEVLAHDLDHFGDARQLHQYTAGFARFEVGNGAVFVWNVNRKPLETTTGADLIYYHARLGQWVLIQYKMLKRENGEPRYRPRADFEAQLAKLRAISAEACRLGASDNSPSSFRLNDAPAYVKFCRPTMPPISNELSKGMYVVVPLYDRLVASGALKGPQGGTVVSFDNVKRWLSNTEFINLFRGGWIGTSIMGGVGIADYVQGRLRDGASLTLATSRT